MKSTLKKTSTNKGLKKDTIIIIGAGLCGSLLALRLAKRGYKIDLYESRPDLRKVDISAGRSINLALSDRGFEALQLAGIEKKARKLCIPMHGRLIHDTKGNTFVSNYSGREGEYINSISRQDLNVLLLNEAEKYKNLSIHFNTKCTSVNLKQTEARFKNYQTKETFFKKANVIFGADGAGSILRKSYYLENEFLFSHSKNYLTHGYKELEIPAGAKQTHLISKDYLHIWPRGEYMLIALPNLDGSFTVTLFLSYEEGEFNFKNLTTEKKITTFFKQQFPDALALIPNIKEEFFNNPTSSLGTVKCSPWHYKNKTLLIGDAAHAIVPFYGQGMNASFEDITVFNQALDMHEGNWETVFKTYEKKRKKNTDAIADLAIENYYEMRDHVANPLFKEKRKIEMALEKNFPNKYFSKYSMVTFNKHLGYAEAHKKGNAQDKVLLNMVAENKINLTNTNLAEVLKKVQTETEKILKEDRVAKL